MGNKMFSLVILLLFFVALNGEMMFYGRNITDENRF